jgi:hypothetical protein
MSNLAYSSLVQVRSTRYETAAVFIVSTQGFPDMAAGIHIGQATVKRRTDLVELAIRLACIGPLRRSSGHQSVPDGFRVPGGMCHIAIVIPSAALPIAQAKQSNSCLARLRHHLLCSRASIVEDSASLHPSSSMSFSLVCWPRRPRASLLPFEGATSPSFPVSASGLDASS